MAYDTGLETRIDEITEQWEEPLTKKKMFGGLGYFIYGNMCFGIHKDDLILRATPEEGDELLLKKGIRVFDMTGRPMKSWFMANDDAISEDINLHELLIIGRNFALALPPK
jgi:TfoX/Sxy family transcriptional regulator of competence genes